MTIRALTEAGLLLLLWMPLDRTTAGRSLEASVMVDTGESAARQAIEQGLVFLEKDGDAWLEGRSHLNKNNGCVSCHVVTFAVWSQTEARRGGVTIGQERVDDLTERAVGFLARPQKGRPVSWGQILLGRDPEPRRVGADRWPEFRDSIIAMQRDEGYWEARGQFPSQRRPVMESNAVATMWNILALASFDEYGDREVASVAEALDWIAGADSGESTEWVLGRLLVEHRLGKPDKRREFLDALLARQNVDGGWGFLADEPSDALTTGQALYALSRAGESQDAEPLSKARAYLLEAQRDDGTWLVPSAFFSKKGDEAKDYIYMYWGTAWATIGLSRSLAASSSS